MIHRLDVYWTIDICKCTEQMDEWMPYLETGNMANGSKHQRSFSDIQRLIICIRNLSVFLFCFLQLSALLKAYAVNMCNVNIFFRILQKQ